MSADPRNMLRYRGDAIDRSWDRKPAPYEIAQRTIAEISWPDFSDFAYTAPKPRPKWDREYRILSDEREKE